MSMKEILNQYEPASAESEKFRTECKQLFNSLLAHKITLEQFERMMAAKVADRGHIETYVYIEPPRPPQVYSDYLGLSKDQKKKANEVLDDAEVKNYFTKVEHIRCENKASVGWLKEHIGIYEKMGAEGAAQRCKAVLQTHIRRREAETISWEEAERRYK